METKTCKECGLPKILKDFRTDKKGKMGKRSKCKECEKKIREGLIGKKRQRSVEKPKFPDHNIPLTNNFKLQKTAMDNYFKVYEYAMEETEPHEFFRKIKEEIIQAFDTIREMSIKFSFEIDLRLTNAHDQDFIITKKNSKSNFHGIRTKEIITDVIENFITTIYESYYDKSGLSVIGITGFRMFMNPHYVSSGSSYVELPDRIKNTKSCLNIKNTKDNKCMLWCLIANFNPNKNNKCFVSSYNKKEYIDQFNMKGISYPVGLNQIHNIENQNNLTINVYRLTQSLTSDNTTIYPISLVYPNISRDINEERHINLLLWKNHYVLINNLGRLFSSCVKGKHTAMICEYCGISVFTTENAKEKHIKICKYKYKEQKYILPVSIRKEFTNYRNMFKVPFIIYSDFESYFIKADKQPTKKIKYQSMHKPSGFGLLTICDKKEYSNEMYSYIGEEADKQFTKYLVNEGKRIEQILSNTIKIEMTRECEKDFEQATKCFICHENFDKGNKIKVQDHDHLTGKYRGAAHKDCNLQFTKKNFTIPVVFHNLEGYDLHLFIDSLAEYGKEFTIIPKSREKYLTLVMKINECRITFRFIDSLHFLSGSLASNAAKLKKEDFELFPNKYEKLKEKQFYPYSYIDSLERLEEQLPINKECWYNELKKEEIKEEDLNHAIRIYNEYNCNNLKDYTRIYLEVDVYLLAEVFENFRKISIKTYNLDPAHYFTTPGFAWDAALMKTRINLELLNDREMIDFFIEKGTMRGGISTVCRKKASTANHKYMENYDRNKASKYIMYFDVTNLYGYTMTGYLPTGKFEWVDELKVKEYEKCLTELYNTIDSETGYILEVDLLYPKELKDKHIELPLAPEHYNGKLTPNLYSKQNYRTRLENLKFYLENGLQLKKIHKILKFEQKKWLKEYIDNNTRMRKETKNENERNFYKLMNNAVYGKTMENVFNRKNYKLYPTTKIDKIIKKTNDSAFKNEYVLTDNLVLLEMEKEEITFDKPIYVGFTILELSKLHMYKLHYEVFKKKYGDRAILMYMDTDSLIYEIRTEDVYDDMNEMKENFDMSVFPKTFKHYNELNKGVLGTLKDEFGNINNELNFVTDFVCLRSKCYYLKTNSDHETRKCKGVPKSELDKITGEQFKTCKEPIEITQTTFKTIKHQIYTIETKKTAISNVDNKRINTENVYTVPWGYDKEFDDE